MRGGDEGGQEAYLPPAKAVGWPGSAPGYGYREEFRALTDPAVAAAVRAERVGLGGDADFA